MKQGIADALRVTADNMRLVYRGIDAAPYVNLPEPENQKMYDEVLHRFKIQKEVARRFAPHKLPILNKLESLAVRHKSGKISNSVMFSEVKKISLQHGLDQSFVNHVRETVKMIEGRRLARPEIKLPVFEERRLRENRVRPVNLPKFELGGRRPVKKNSGLDALKYLFGGGK